MGALICLALVLGATSDELIRLCREFGEASRRPKLRIKHLWRTSSLCSDSEIISKILRRLFTRYDIPRHITFSELYSRTSIRLQVSVTSLVLMQAVHIDHELYGDAEVFSSILASMALPPVFPPVSIPGIPFDVFTDGAVTNGLCLNRNPLYQTLFLHTSEGRLRSEVKDILQTPFTYGSRIMRIMTRGHTQKEQERLFPRYRKNVMVFPRRFQFHIPASGDSYDVSDLLAKGYIWAHAHHVRFTKDPSTCTLSNTVFAHVIKKRQVWAAILFVTALIIFNRVHS